VGGSSHVLRLGNFQETWRRRVKHS
jgi:hypothetical protein